MDIDIKYLTIGYSVITILITIIFAYILNRFFKRLVKKSSTHLNNDPTNYLFLRRALVIIVYAIGFSIAIYIIPELRTLAKTIFAGAGILAVAVGFASQHALSNVISGVFIVLFKPFRINDRIEVRNYMGVIEDITLRHVVIRDFQNRRVIIPNAIISDEALLNSDHVDQRICRWIEIGISYGSNVDLAKSIIEDEILKHPLHIDGRNEEQIANNVPEVPVRIVSLGDSSVNLRGWAWANDVAEAFQMQCDLLESIKKRFEKEGIEIPFPHRTVYHRGEGIRPIP